MWLRVLIQNASSITHAYTRLCGRIAPQRLSAFITDSLRPCRRSQVKRGHDCRTLRAAIATELYCTSTVAGTTTSSYTYNTFNQLTASTGISSYTYDDNGNMKAKTGYTYTYDGENRLVEVQNTSNVVIGSYTYNERGLRIRKTEVSTPV